MWLVGRRLVESLDARGLAPRWLAVCGLLPSGRGRVSQIQRLFAPPHGLRANAGGNLAGVQRLVPEVRGTFAQLGRVVALPGDLLGDVDGGCSGV